MKTLASAETGCNPSPSANLFFLHGFACAKEDWGLVAKHLPSSLKHDAIDLPGHGRKNLPAVGRPPQDLSEWSIRSIRDEVIRKLPTDDDSPVILVGHSMGCRVVLDVAASAPERVGGVVLIEGSMLGGATPESAREQVYVKVREEGAVRFLQNRFEAMFLRRDSLSEGILERAKAMDLAGAIALFADMASWDVEFMADRLSALTKPLMLIQSMYFDETGKRLPIEFPTQSSWINMVGTLVPNARMEVVKDCGHFPHLEQPAMVAQMLTSFASTIDKAAVG